MEGKILVGFAGGAPSLDALTLAGALADATGAGILAVHVVDAERPYTPYNEPLQHDLRDNARQLLSTLHEAAPKLAPGARVSFRTITAQTAAMGLHEFAASEGASVIVVGSTRFNPVVAVLLGATGELLLKGSPCPVAVASHDLHRRAPLRLRRIGFGFDGSPECVCGLETASNLARAADAELHALTVVPRRRLGGRIKRESLTAEAGMKLERALADCGAPDADARVVCGHAPEVLENVGEQCDLMVIGSCGHAPMQHALTGSVSSALVRGAKVPMLVVPRGAAAVATPA